MEDFTIKIVKYVSATRYVTRYVSATRYATPSFQCVSLQPRG